MKTSKREKMKVAKIIDGKEASIWQRKMTETSVGTFRGKVGQRALKEQPGTWETRPNDG
jgi:hypothetical protein